VSPPKALPSSEVEDGEVDDAKASTSAEPAGGTAITAQGIPTANTPKAPVPLPENSSPSTPLPVRVEPVPRASTPKAPASMPSQSGPAQRSDNSRSFSSSILDKQHPGLPSRPDVPFPSHRLDRHMSSRPGERRDGHQIRGDRPGDIMRDRPRDSLERRGLDNIPRDLNRPSDRSLGPDRERDRHDPIRRGGEPRDSRDARENRDLRDRSSMDNMRLPDTNGRLTRGDAMGPPRPATLQSDRASSTLNAERLLPVNAERLAHMPTNNEQRPDPPRGGREEHRDRPPSRPHSPRRVDSYIAERDHLHGRRNDRSNIGRSSISDMQDFPRNRHDEQWAAPAGPRDDRPSDRGTSERGRDSSTFQPSQPPPRSLDPDHGRLNQTSRPQPDPNFGRLNSGPPPPIPSGPRDRNMRLGGGPGGANRMPSVPQSRFEGRSTQQDPPRPPTPDRQPPTGPASNRPPRHSAPGQFDAPAPPTIPASSSTVAASLTTSIHPDRLKHLDTIESQGNLQSTPQQASPPPLPTVPSLVSGVHPDRLKAIHGDQGPPRPPPLPAIQTANIRSSTINAPSPVSSGPPLGPKGHHSSNNTPSTPNGMSAPTGPASNIDRTRGPRRQLAGIQNTLQQAGQQGPERFGDRVTNIRGRSTRNSGLNSPGVEPHSPSGPPTPTMPTPRPDAREGFMPSDRNRDVISSDRPDLFSNRGHNGLDNDHERERADSHTRVRDGPPASGRRERSDRHNSRRNSREHSPARDHREDREQRSGREPRILDDPSRSGEEYRGRRTGERDRRQGGSSEMSGRGGERELGGRRDGGDKNRAGPSLELEWSGNQSDLIRGSGGRRDGRSGVNDGRRDSRGGREDGSGSSRKRRTDESGLGGDIRGHDKRPRR
jgi:THO complex subunit 2